MKKKSPRSSTFGQQNVQLTTLKRMSLTSNKTVDRLSQGKRRETRNAERASRVGTATVVNGDEERYR